MKKVSFKQLSLFILISFFLQLILFSLFLGGSSAEAKTPEAKEKLKLGIIIPLSGDSVAVGEAMKNGMLLAYNKLPQSTKDKLELVFEDDRMQAASAITAFNKLVNIDQIDLLINASSGTGNALAPLADKKKLPFISISTDPRVVLNRKYVVAFWVSADAEAELAVAEAVKRGYKTIARISTMQDGFLALRDLFDQVNAGKISIPLDEEYPDKIKDFRTFITKIRNADSIDAVMVNMMPGQCGVFVKQLREMGVSAPVFGFETFEESNEVKASENTLVGAWYVNADDPKQSFIEEYEKNYPDASFWIAPNAHDAILLMGAAVGKSTNPEAINEFLHTVKDFQGVLGTFSASEDNRFTLPAAVKVVTKDGFQKLY
jgi:branched-chain amino acid transport system substrate-binding protein